MITAWTTPFMTWSALSVCLLVCITRGLRRRKQQTSCSDKLFLSGEKFELSLRKLTGSFSADGYLKYEKYGFPKRCVVHGQVNFVK